MLNFTVMPKSLKQVRGAWMLAATLVCAGGLASPPAVAGTIISNDLSKCAAGAGSSILVDVSGFQAQSGLIRVQVYPATDKAWLTKGAWLVRIDTPVRVSAGKMRFCLPVPGAGRYGVAVRHDRNGNGKTDLMQDGGGFSNNPALSIFNLGKPAASKAAVAVGKAPVSVSIRLQYM